MAGFNRLSPSLAPAVAVALVLLAAPAAAQDHHEAKRFHERRERLPAVGLDPAQAARDLHGMVALLAPKAAVAGLPTALSAKGGPAPPAVYPRGSAWTSPGPGNVGGIVRTLVIHPTTRVMYAGSVTGGVWKTADGITWENASGDLPTLSIGALALDPTNPATMYAGTGTVWWQGTGIYKTTDGRHWTPLPQTAAFRQVVDLALGPDGKTLLAATANGIQASFDAGQTWRTAGNTAGRRMVRVRIDPGDKSRAIAGGIADLGNPNDHVSPWYSTDGGATWQRASVPGSVPMDRWDVTYAAKDSSIVYASGHPWSGPLLQVWRSTDGGQSFTRKGAADPNQIGYTWTNVIWAGDLEDEDVVVFGGTVLFRSTDGGDTALQITDGNIRVNAHSDNHALVSDPGNTAGGPATVYLGCDGGVYKAADLTTATTASGWSPYFAKGFNVTQFYRGGASLRSGKILGGAQDNGTWAYLPVKGPDAWEFIRGGDEGPVASDPQDGDRFYSKGQWTLDLSRNVITDGGPPTVKPIDQNLDDPRKDLAVRSPLLMDPYDSRRLYTGGAAFWRSDDPTAAAPAWAQLLAPQGTNPPAMPTVTAAAISRIDPKNLLVAYSNGSLFYTQDGTAPAGQVQWRRIDTGWGSITDIAFDPYNMNVFFAIAGNRVRRSPDQGRTWQDVTGNLPASAALNVLAIHPQNSNYLYVGTDIGVFGSGSGGNVWHFSQQGPVGVSVTDLFWSDTTLIAATFGQSMFWIDLSLVPSIAAYGGQLYAIKPSDRTAWQLNGPGTGWTQIAADVNQIAAGSAGVFIEKTDNGIYRNGGTPGQWTRVGERSMQLAAGASSMFILSGNPRSSVFRYGGSPDDWTMVGTDAKQIAAGSGLYLVKADDDSLWSYDGSGSSWTQIGSNVMGLVADGDDLYVVSDYALGSFSVWKYDGSPFRWTYIASNTRAIAAGNGRVYTISSVDDSVWEIDPTVTPATAVQIGAQAAKSLIAEGRNLYRVDPDSTLWKYGGAPGQWTRLPPL